MGSLDASLDEPVKRRLAEPEEAHLEAVDKPALARKLQADGIELDLDGGGTSIVTGFIGVPAPGT